MLTDRSVIHDTFTIERTYSAPPSRVFAAFASAEAMSEWCRMAQVEAAAAETTVVEFDFRIGGHERSGHVWHGRTHRSDAVYYDIVTDQRIVYAYEMYADDVRMSVSVTTIEFAETGGSTVLIYTEQGAFLNGIDGPQAPVLRRNGTAEMLDNLTAYLAESE